MDDGLRKAIAKQSRTWRRTLALAALGVSWGAAAVCCGADADELIDRWSEQSGVQRGDCALVGLGDAELTGALAAREEFYLHALDPDAEAVEAARKAVDRNGWYGNRVVIERSRLDLLPYASNLLDLVIVPNLSTERLADVSPREVLRVLRPRGTAFLGVRSGGRPESAAADLADALKPWLEKAGIEGAEIEQEGDGTWVLLRKRPRDGVDSWSHWEHGPDNNPLSHDGVIKAPYMSQWFGDPLYIAMPAITTSAGGRVFMAMGHIAHHVREEPWLNTLMARNGYNGTILWTKKLPDGYLAHRSAFIATEETFYMIDPSGMGVVMLDPETGEEKGRLRVPGVRGDWKWVAMKNGVLYALVGRDKDPAETTIVRSEDTHWSWGELSPGYYKHRVPWGFGTTLLALDADEGKPIWVHREKTAIDSRAMVLGADRLFYFCPDSHLGCLDAASGSVVWTSTDSTTRDLINEPGRGLTSTPGFRSACYSIYTPEALVFEAQTHMNAVAVSPEDGRLLWHKKKTTSNPNMLFTDNRLYLGLGPDGSTLAIEPKTGQVFEDLGFKKRSCARLTATSDSFFCRGWPDGLTRFDRGSKEVLFNGAFRPSCNDGVIAANGMLYLGPWACDCNLSVMGRVALCSASDFQPDPRAVDRDRLIATEQDLTDVEPLDESPHDWPTYRGDVARSGSSGAAIDGEISSIWEARPDVAFRPTPPTAAGGLVFVGGEDGKLRALDARTGQLRWMFFTAGPIVQPPTYWRGRVFCGSGDGYVYAVQAATGRLLWQFRPAPAERRIMVYGSLASTWPVHSGIAIHDQVAYASAGIIDYDGTYVCGLDAVTGEPRWVNGESGHLDSQLRKGVSAQGNLTVADGRLWMSGGNVVSPASFNLVDGQYVGPNAGDGSPRTNRGEEIGVFLDRYVIQGGRLRFSAVRNVVDPGIFTAQAILPDHQLGPVVNILNGKIAPVWNHDHFVMVNGRRSPPICYTSQAMREYLDDGKPRNRPRPTWTADALKGTDTVSLAVTPDAVIAVCEAPQHRQLESTWKVCTLSIRGGELLSQRNLPGEAVPGGLAIDRDGRVLVVLQDGTVACLGGPRALKDFVASMAEEARQDGEARERVVRMLSASFKGAHTPETRDMVLEILEELGARIGEYAERNGCISRWHLLGHVPWDEAEQGVDQVWVGEPDVDISQSYVVDGRPVRWRPYVGDDSDGRVNLAETIGSPGSAAAYAYGEFHLTEPRQLALRIGSNDGFKCWFNGEEVGRFDGGRSYAPEQDVVNVQGQRGVNRLLMKITQLGGRWAFSVRVTDTEGRPVNLAQIRAATANQ
jgi:outer membrane protein assembly factor BamB/SAM-dependent methyltransferase